MRTKILFLLLACAICSLPLVAEVKGGSAETQRVLISDRALSVEDTFALKEKRAHEEEENSSLQVTADSSSDLMKKGFSDRYPRNYKGSHHWAMSVSPSGDIIEIEDGSIWNVRCGKEHKTLNWLTSDKLYIKPNNDLFSLYDYKICNATTCQSVDAKLSMGPYSDGLFTLYIAGIDDYSDHVILSDGSSWNVSTFDRSIVASWLPGDAVIVGVNDEGFLSAFNPYILINVDTNSYARASIYTY